jgi:glycosyltransferase involved in cell wall biosynthesis
MAKEPLVTIGITCYNEGDWLLECWQSVLAQTDDRWVAVLVMDGSSHERTREIFEQLEHGRLSKYAMPENLGPYPVRNKTFELAQTPYFFWLDGDDQLLPNTIALVLEAFSQHPEAGYVYGDYEVFGNQQEVWHYPYQPVLDDWVEGQVTPCGGAYRVALWRQLGGFPEELARGNGDYDFLIGAAEAGVVGYHCGQVFYRYRVGDSNRVSGSYARRYHETHEIIVRRHPRFFQDRQRRNRFLALGYKRAAEGNHLAGEPKQAAHLAGMALRHGLWHDRRVWYLWLGGILGRHALDGIWALGRRGWHVLRRSRP